MRGLRDGVKVPFDQFPPPDEGTLPAPELVVAPEDVEEITCARSPTRAGCMYP